MFKRQVSLWIVDKLLFDKLTCITTGHSMMTFLCVIICIVNGRIYIGTCSCMQFIIGCYNINVIILIAFRMDVVLIALVLQCCVVAVSGYPGGAPSSSCAGMVPGHGAAVQAGASPYTVTMNASTYTAGDVIEGMACVYCFES